MITVAGFGTQMDLPSFPAKIFQTPLSVNTYFGNKVVS